MTDAGDVPQPTGHAMALHRIADRLGDHQPDLRDRPIASSDRRARMHD